MNKTLKFGKIRVVLPLKNGQPVMSSDFMIRSVPLLRGWAKCNNPALMEVLPTIKRELEKVWKQNVGVVAHFSSYEPKENFKDLDAVTFTPAHITNLREEMGVPISDWQKNTGYRPIEEEWSNAND